MDDSSKQLIDRYMEQVLEVNKTLNLTRIEDSEHARLLHIEDSLAGLDELNQAPEGRYVDLGSGGGFPGVPLGIVSGRQTLLVDSVKKKMAAERFSVATARALAKLSVLMELSSPLLKKGGALICYKAQLSDEELDNALRLQSYLGMKLKSDRDFLLSDNETHRRIIVFEKVKQPGLKLPRRVGLAQKKPL